MFAVVVALVVASVLAPQAPFDYVWTGLTGASVLPQAPFDYD